METNTPEADRFSANLHAARGIASVVVVAFHALLTFRVAGIPEPYHRARGLINADLRLFDVLHTAAAGEACVTLFFVLSGAVLAMSLDRNPLASANDIIAFYVKRGLRLYPLLIFATLFSTTLISLLRWSPGNSSTLWIKWAHDTASVNWRSISLNALGLSFTLNPAAWSIKVELLASALFPIIYLTSRRSMTAVALGALLVIYMLVPHNPLRFGQVLEFLLAFLLGSSLVQCARTQVFRLSTWPSLYRGLLFSIAVGVLILPRRIVDRWGTVPDRLILVEIFAATLIVALLLSARDDRASSHRIVRAVGDASYGVYLLHLPILFALQPLVSTFWPQLGWLGCFMVLFATTLSVALLMSRLTFRLVERPGNLLGRFASAQIRQRREQAKLAEAG